VLLDIEAMMGVMTGVVMELVDCALPLLKGNWASLVVFLQYELGLTYQGICLLVFNINIIAVVGSSRQSV